MNSNQQILFNQKHFFNLNQDVCYLNCAAYSPLLNVSVEAGQRGIALKVNPVEINPQKNFFENVDRVRLIFSDLVNANDFERIAVIGSVAYGMAVVANNLHRLPDIAQKKHVILIEEEFPNNVYAFERVNAQLGLTYLTIGPNKSVDDTAKSWNENILNAITNQTAMIVMPHIHWIYGVRFDLETISKRCKEVGALLIIDGTQSVGAFPFDIEKIQPDALICASYKWLLGPYSMGLAYFGEFFDNGVPIEESWMNRKDSDKFAQLTNYERAYRPKAQRYNVGESSHFIQMPMLETSLKQIMAWGVENIQNYTKSITENAIEELQKLGCKVASESYRVNHLFGVSLPYQIDSKQLYDNLTSQNIIVSLRGTAIRVSPHLYNDESDLDKLVETIAKTL
ncbi:MAG: aminotransferase class V-fold PLP-dependent enzyme [Spirosomaceae bacterium]|nr:aminotransferase class V-fold PLP-dependent enzyme [Spirosomataceae bacterium]